MDSIRDIRIRLNSVNSTKQITESMRLISTRKIRKTKERMEGNRRYLTQSVEVIKDLMDGSEVKDNVYITGRETGKSLIIMITGDRGLCGGYNSNVGKEAFRLAEELGETKVLAIGAKGRDYFRRRHKEVLQVFTGLSENPFFEDAQAIGTLALNMFDDHTVDEIYLVYTEYQSMLFQEPKTVCLLPLSKSGVTGGEEGSSGANMRYEPGEARFLKYATHSYICAVLFGAMLEAAVSEQSARITGMDSAVKNADKITDSLAVQYNQMRQGAITQEITEIVGGANAVSQIE